MFIFGAGDTDSGRRPKRPCPFCGIFQSKLRRHILTKHKSEKKVTDLGHLPKVEQDREIENLRKMGIYLANKKALGEKNKKLIRERRQKKSAAEDLVMCGYCRGFYSKRFFYKHKAQCAAAESGGNAVSVPVPVVMQHDVEDEFSREVLSKFQQDSVGKLCQSDEVVTAVGRHLYRKNKRKQAKKPDVRKGCMREMRRLASLSLAFRGAALRDNKELSTADMLHRTHFEYLENAVEELSQDSNANNELKAGTKLGLGYVLKTAAKVMKGKYLIDNNDDKARDVDNFSTVLSLNWADLFGDAECKVITNRQERLRQPARLPNDDDVAKIRDYTVSAISELCDQQQQQYNFWTSSDFVLLRNLLVSRLTLFNARRGGEPSRLLMREWADADNNVWLPEDSTAQIDDPAEKVLVGMFKVAYQAGKGSQHLVSLLIPHDCLEGMRILTNAEIRSNAGVLKSNPFVFASTQSSTDHVSGWHATNDICVKVGVKSVTATDMRHRVSTYYASLEVPESDRKHFYSHLGHSANINLNVYQCPPAVAAITKVGKHLNDLDTHGM